ncbi:MAG: polymer-forming cytoskeletal protein [Bacillota bacterium]
MVHAEIRGKVNGDIYGAGKVRVASTGFCSSRIRADYLEVAGEVKGAVEAGRLVVLRTGRVHGGARFRSLFVQPGGILEVQEHFAAGTREPCAAAPVPSRTPAALYPPAPQPAVLRPAVPQPGAPQPAARQPGVLQPAARQDAGSPGSDARPSGPVFHISF